MLKKTLWYACLVLLCCGLSALVVLATSAGKTTLLPASTPSTDARAEVGGLVPASAPTAVTNDAKPETGTVSKGSQGEAPSEAIARGTLEAPGLDGENPVLLRKQRELTAIAHGMDPNTVSAASDAELAGFTGVAPAERAAREELDAASSDNTISSSNDEATQKLQEQRDAADAAAQVAQPVITPEPQAVSAPIFESYPDFGAAGQSLGPIITDEAEAPAQEANSPLEKQARELMDRAQAGEQLTPAEKATLEAYSSGSPRGRGGSLDNSGGPDAGGYRYMDNVAPDTATYSWIELRGEAGVTWINLWTSHDDGYSYVGATSPGARHPIGFSFDFYGVLHDSFRVSTNGFVQFTTTSSSLSNAVLPSSGVAGPAIFAYWDDLHLDRAIPTGTDVVGYKNFGTYTVIEYDSIGVYNSSCVLPNSRLKFEVILHNNGKIKIQYNLIDVCDAQDSSMTVGIQSDGVGTSGALQYCYGSGGQTLVGPLPVAGRAIWFNPEPIVSPYANDFKTSVISVPAAGVSYAPSSLVTVTARFRNLGSTTQSSPVEYQFNGGGIVTEATASLVQSAFEDHSFATQITMPGTPGVYELVVRTALTTDQDLTNDTLRRNVNVAYDGYTCTSAIAFTSAGPDSLTFSNCGAGDNNPGQPCPDGASSFADMVFFMVVPDGQQAEIWQSSNLIDSRHTLRWGGPCPGTNLLGCLDDPDERKYRFVNHTGVDTTLFFTIGGYYSGTACGNFKVDWWRQTDPTYTPPYTSSFEITVAQPLVPTYHTLPNFWSYENSNGDDYLWENYNSGAANGTYCARSYAGLAAGNNDWLFSPSLNLSDGQTYFLDYFRKAYTATYPESLEVKIGTQNASGAMTQTIFPLDTFKTTTWVEKGQAFTVPSAGVYYIGFHSMTMRSGDGCYIDSVRVLVGLCSAPTVTANAATGTYSATLTSTASGGHGGAIQYQWFTGDSCVNGNQIAYANAASYTALTSGTYSLRAWRGDSVNCAACDSALATVTSSCTPQTIPYIDNFDDVTAPALPVCWLQESTDAVSPVWATNTTTPLTAPNDAYILGSTNGNNDWLFTEPLSLTGGTAYVFQYWRRAYSSSVSDCVQVKYGTTPLSGAMLNTIQGPDTCKTSGSYTKKASVFTPASTGTYYIGINSLTKGTSAGTRIDSVHVYAYGPCAAPAVTVNAGTGQYSVTLTATATGGFGGPFIYQWYTGETCTDGNEIVGATASKYTAWAAGIYACRVYCGPDSVTCAGCDSANVVLTCTTPTTPPIFEGFESTTGTALPTCWTYEDFFYTSIYWRTTTTTPHSGLRDVYMYGYQGTYVADDWMYTQGLALTGGTTYWLQYWRRNSTNLYADSLEIKYGATPTYTAMTSVLAAADTNKTTTWVRKVASFTPSVNGTYHIGFHCMSRWYTSSAYTYIDDIRVYPSGFCDAPDSVRVAAVMAQDSVTLTANVYGGWGGSPQYQWYTGVNCQTGNEITGETNATYKTYVSGTFSCKAWFLDPDTCFACDSAWAEVIPCSVPQAVPMFEGFEATTGTVLPICWSYEDLFYATNYWRTTTTTPHTGLRDVYMYGYQGTYVADDWMYTRGLAFTGGTTYWLEYWRRNSTASYADSLEIMYGTTPTYTAMTNVLAAADTNKTTTWVRKTASFTPSVTGMYHIGFHCMSRWYASSAYTYIDDIRVYPDGMCDAPDSVKVAAVAGTDSATLTAVVYGGFGGSPQYQWYTGVNCQTGNEIGGETNATYETFASGVFSCKVWFTSADTCAACDSGYADVIDCDIPLTLPVYEGFETTAGTALPVCWTQMDLNGDARPWVTNTVYPRTGLRHAFNNYSSGTATNDWMFTRAVALTAGDSVVVDYWYRCYLASTSYFESLELLAGSAQHPDSMTSIVDTNFIFSNVSVYTLRTHIWVVPSTGTYYFGLHAGYLIDQGGVCVDDIKIYLYGSCGAPDVVQANAAVGTLYAKLTATVSGGHGGALQYQWYTGLNCQSGNEIGGETAKDYYAVVSGIYSVKAWFTSADTCAACDSALATVNPDPCAPYAVTPFSEGFESTTGTALPTCWSYQDLFYASNYWRTTTTTPHAGLRDVYMYGYAGTYVADDWMYTAPMVLQGGVEYALDYWRRNSSATYADSLEIMYGTVPLHLYMTNVVAAADTNKTTVWVNKAATFTPAVTDTYYVGFHCMSRWYTSSAYTYLDDIMLYRADTCAAPTVTVADSTRIGLVTMTAVMTGGIGAPIVYQWYTGGTCDNANRIVGATNSSYQTTVSGTYSCRVYRRDSTACAACDSGVATVLPIPPGDACTTAWTLTLVPNDSVTYTGTTVGFTADCRDSCGNVSQSLDVFYRMTLTQCRRLAFKLTTGDMFLSVFEDGMCCVRSFLCNDDVSGWSQTIPWEDVAWRPTGVSSYVAGELPAGVYYIRVGYYSTSSGAYVLTVRDYGPCPCEITCQGGDVAEMAESRYDTTFYRTDPDGGCNSTPVAFGATDCEQTICGTAFTYQRLPSAGTSYYRDTDWYLFTLTARRVVTLRVNPEFPAGALVIDTNGCVGAVAMFGDTAIPACSTRSASDTLDAGTYAVVVYPRYFAGNPLPSQYRASLACSCLVGPRPTDVTCRYDSADGTPTGTNYWNDMRIRWTADSGMVGTGTYTIYYNLNDNAFPGGAGWTLLASGIAPVAGPHNTTYVDLNVVNATIVRRFYLVVSVCQ